MNQRGGDFEEVFVPGKVRLHVILLALAFVVSGGAAALILWATGWTEQTKVFVLVSGGLALCMIVGIVSFLRHRKSIVVKITSSQLVVSRFGRTRVFALDDISSIEERTERIFVVAAGKAVDIEDWQFVNLDEKARFLGVLRERVSRVQNAADGAG